jgi:putative MATE family efflux protein
VDEERGVRTADLAWPRMLTGLARVSQRTADFVMLGWVAGPPALAGLAFGLAFWQVGNTVSLGLSGGTISMVSQRFGADDPEGVDRAVKASLVVTTALAVAFTLAFWTAAGDLVSLLGDDPAAVDAGATYLRVVALGFVFEFANKVGSRALVGADDSHTPMVVRGGGAVLNVVLNAVFIFGFGLGVAGAALGTAAASLAVALAFGWAYLTGSLPVVGAVPVRVRTGVVPTATEFRRLWTVGLPLVGRRLAPVLGIFPLLAVAASFGPVVVAAFEVSRRVRRLVATPNWGFTLAASSLVGQELGRGDPASAAAYGRDALRFSLVVHAAVGVPAVLLARPIAGAFLHDPAEVATAVPFVRVAAVSVVGVGVDGVATGVLRGSGDTRWPFYGKVLGFYAVAIPAATFGAPVVGVAGLYVALLAETLVPAAVSAARFRSGAWLPDPDGDADAAGDDARATG